MIATERDHGHHAADDPGRQAAGLIHSDLERGFIKAETIAYQVLGPGKVGTRESGCPAQVHPSQWCVQARTPPPQL